MISKVRLLIDGVAYKLEIATDVVPCISCALREECEKEQFFCFSCFDFHWIKLDLDGEAFKIEPSNNGIGSLSCTHREECLRGKYTCAFRSSTHWVRE